jgi:phosphoribosylaminoimidazolecarboxamide formyltransferase/IMP cyclohydrolase
MNKIKRTLISVYDKTGIVEFAKELQKLNIEIIATSKTASLLKKEKINVKRIDELTHFPEMLNGRVKTLHPAIHAGILFKRNDKKHIQEVKKYNIFPIDMVVVNLYSFEETIKKNLPEDEIIEQIDIGGVSLIRSAAKNFKYVTTVTNVEQYNEVINELKLNNGKISLETNKKFAYQAFSYVAEYDLVISQYFTKISLPFPDTLLLRLKKLYNLRYGENPHQHSAFYSFDNRNYIKQLHGKELSYNNILDINSAISILSEFDEPTACVIKHTNPCGVSTNKIIENAYINAFNADKTSAYGGIIGINRPVTNEIAEHISKNFIEIVVAPKFNSSALKILMRKKNIRLIEFSKFDEEFEFRSAISGILVQEKDRKNVENLTFISNRKPKENEIEDAIFSYKVVKHVKSNAIVIAKNKLTLGICAGQTSRIDAIKIACEKAKENAKGAVLASDGFLPKIDNIECAFRYGISTIIHPGGSIEDKNIIEFANKHNIAIILTGIRHFKH